MDAILSNVYLTYYYNYYY